MASPALQNVWHHRKVADDKAKSCWVCYKPSVNVLVTPDNKDFFYICAGHLTDRGFATPDKDEAAAAEARRKKAELDAEIEKVKKEYADKIAKKAEKKAAKAKGSKEKTKDDNQKDKDDEKSDEKELDEKIKALEKGKDPAAAKFDDGPRIYSLNKSFFQQRLDKKRNAEIAKRDRERMKDPNYFPAVPTGDP